jgi:hypothetical protein
VSHVDVKDASAGVLKDLKRFQTEKEDDLKRYMVRKLHFYGVFQLTNVGRSSSLSPNAILNGPSATWNTGMRPSEKWKIFRLRSRGTTRLRDAWDEVYTHSNTTLMPEHSPGFTVSIRSSILCALTS